MGIEFNNSNFSKIATKLHKCCLSEEICGVCKSNNHLIKYGNSCLKEYIINKITGVIDGYKHIPVLDTKVYDEYSVIDGISNILSTCKNCNENHYDICIINILRNCYEIILLGHDHEYSGSTLLYLSQLKESNPDISDKIFSKLTQK